MTRLLKHTLAMLMIVASLSVPALAQTSPVPQSTAPTTQKVHPCKAEHQNVVAQCKNGDPCGPSCKQAHQAMKACRVANNLPLHKHDGMHEGKSPCKMKGASAPGATQGAMPNTMPGTMNGPPPSNLPSMPAHPSDSSATPPQ